MHRHCIAALVVSSALPTAIAQQAPASGSAADAGTAAEPRASFLSRSPLVFEPLLADPHWPHFSAAWQSWHASEFDSVGAVSFGESFTFHRVPWSERAALDIGFQAGVSAIFDLEQDSLDLVNADYLGGPVLAARHGPFSALLRLLHESSHLGDEYLLRTGATRINLSYETADLLLSWQMRDTVRVYVGAGHIVHTDTPLQRWLGHAGAEWLAAGGPGSVRPLAAVDVQSREYTDWTVDVSVRAGVQFQDRDAPRGRVQLLLEYYTGSSPHGQFFVDEVEWLGVGLHFYF
jgi:hypothetical protein